MADTSNAVANEAIQLIGDNQPVVTGNAPNFDSSPPGVACKYLYVPTVRAVGRRFGWDFARNNVALALSGNVAFPLGWAYEYLYPGNGVEIWQLMPAALADPNNPLPVNWAVGNTLVSSVQTKVIWSNQQAASALYNNAPNESTWDPLFREAVVRILSSALAMALEGRPDTAAAMLESGEMFERLGEQRWD